MTIEISIPNVALKEYEYIIDVLFSEFLGIPYILKIAEQETKFVTIKYKKYLIKIENYFFSSNDLKELYSVKNIPKESKRCQVVINSETFSFQNIYGIGVIDVFENEVIFHSDIISSSFLC